VRELALAALLSIRLRMNPNDTDRELRRLNTRLLDRIAEIDQYLIDGKFGEAEKAAKNLHVAAAPVLKAEWKRVKRGEPVYRIAKYSAATLIVFALALVAYMGLSAVQLTTSVVQPATINKHSSSNPERQAT
jgi:hypothetical protein